MLVQHSRTGHAMGVPVDNTLIIDNGDVVELTPDSIRKGNAVKAGIELLDQSRNGIVDARVLKGTPAAGRRRRHHPAGCRQR